MIENPSLRKAQFWSLLAGFLAVAPAFAAEEPDENVGTITFCARLSPDEESAPTESPAIGLGTFILRRSDLQLGWYVKFEKLSGPAVEAEIHAPQRPGANAPAIFPLAPSRHITSPIRGALVLNDGQLQYLLDDRMYVNITTRKYPEGELRAQLRRQRPGTLCEAVK
jgi:hypothetical protein